VSEAFDTPGALPSEAVPLRRVLGLPVLVLYGLGSIVGAGIYVLVGHVAGAAGMAAPIAFGLAGLLAGITGLSYAELSGRHPEAAGAVAYVREGFGVQWLGAAVGVALVAVAVLASASIALGSAGYLREYVAIPEWLGASLLVLAFLAVAAVGISESAKLAAVLAVVEILGLVVVVVAAGPALTDLPARAPEMLPGSAAAWVGVLAATYLAFFAFLGFDCMVNLAEETRDVARVLPRAVVIAIAVATVLYVAVALVAVLALPPAELSASRAPLVRVLEAAGVPIGRHFAAVALIATCNGLLLDMVLAARLIYGMARRKMLPAAFGRVHPRTRTPLLATAVAGALVLALVAAVPFEGLVAATSGVTIGVFLAVNAALIRLKRTQPRRDLTVVVPMWVPAAGVASCVLLLAAAALG